MKKEINNNNHKWFIVSDVHSFFNELKRSLYAAGFNSRNKNHTLIVIGDVFDRGDDTLRVFHFLSSMPKKRCILIRGNHERLFLDLLNKSFPDDYDFDNHTVDTFCQIAGYNPQVLSIKFWYEHAADKSGPYSAGHAVRSIWQDIRETVKEHPITQWLQSSQWRNYYELDRYIFCHSFLPTKLQEYDPDWRNASDARWEEASWGDPIARYKSGLFWPESKKGKVLVVGHWHTGDFYYRISNHKSYDEPITDIWFGEDMIAIDGGVFKDYATGKLVHPQNVLVIDSEDFAVCYNEYGRKLEPVPCLRKIETITP